MNNDTKLFLKEIYFKNKPNNFRNFCKILLVVGQMNPEIKNYTLEELNKVF